MVAKLSALALLAAAVPAHAQRVEAIATRYAFAGEVLVSHGDTILVHEGFGPVAPNGKARHKPGERWRLASITKQVTAALLVRDRWRELDQPLRTSSVSLRQLLTHHTGLADPDDTPMSASGVPSFYTRATPDLEYCRSKPATPGSAFSYNNCDYLIAATLLRNPVRWPAGMVMAKGRDQGVPGYIGGKPEPSIRLSSYGAAGGLVGSLKAVFRFDRALMTDRLLPPPALAALWAPEGGGSAQALGQWVFSAPLAGCEKPVRIVQRDGEIEGVQGRNFILPEKDMTVIAFTNRSSDDFTFGEVWQGSGFVYDLLSAAACSKS